MKRIVLLRHGESVWNRENRFTGWADVPLTAAGIAQARAAGDLLKRGGFAFEIAFVSVLRRAVKTLDCVLERMEREWIPVEKSWRLNEKHYGALQGLNKRETAEKYGEAQVLQWRRAYAVAPPPLSPSDPRNPRFDLRYRDVPDALLPLTESLKDTVARIKPFWKNAILPALKTADDVLVAAHGNSLRGVIKAVEGISDAAIVAFNLPTGIPYALEYDDDLRFRRGRFLGEPAEIEKLQRQIAEQGMRARA